MISDYYWRPTPQIVLCDEELSLNIELTFDKEVYEPKDEAEITIKVTDKGKGVKAGVDLSALDTAYIDANGEVSSNIISSLINNYSISSSSNTKRVMSKNASAINSYAMAEEAPMAMDEAKAMGGSNDSEYLSSTYYVRVPVTVLSVLYARHV